MAETARRLIRQLALDRPALLHIHRSWRDKGQRYHFTDLVAGALIIHDYSGRMILDGFSHELLPGSLSLIPCGTDRIFLNATSGWHRVINVDPEAFRRPLVSHIDLSYRQRCREFDDCLALYAAEKSRAEVRTWDLLWGLQDSVDWSWGDPSLPPLIEEAVKQIEWNLSAPFPITELARRLGVSGEHLSRRFRQALGVPATTYQRQRRMLLARHLLENTNQSIKEVASACGLPDAQWFNKTVRKAFGCSPSGLRRRFQSRLPGA